MPLPDAFNVSDIEAAYPDTLTLVHCNGKSGALLGGHWAIWPTSSTDYFLRCSCGCQDNLYTVYDFEDHCGRKASRKWRESIRVADEGRMISLGQWIEDCCNAADAGMPEEGWRVSVYWPADKAWYAGEIKYVDEYGRSLVAYDDGQVEVLHFAVERFRAELATPDSKEALEHAGHTAQGIVPADTNATSSEGVIDLCSSSCDLDDLPNQAPLLHNQPCAGSNAAIKRPYSDQQAGKVKDCARALDTVLQQHQSTNVQLESPLLQKRKDSCQRKKNSKPVRAQQRLFPERAPQAASQPHPETAANVVPSSPVHVAPDNQVDPVTRADKPLGSATKANKPLGCGTRAGKSGPVHAPSDKPVCSGTRADKSSPLHAPLDKPIGSGIRADKSSPVHPPSDKPVGSGIRACKAPLHGPRLPDRSQHLKRSFKQPALSTLSVPLKPPIREGPGKQRSSVEILHEGASAAQQMPPSAKRIKLEHLPAVAPATLSISKTATSSLQMPVAKIVPRSQPQQPPLGTSETLHGPSASPQATSQGPSATPQESLLLPSPACVTAQPTQQLTNCQRLLKHNLPDGTAMAETVSNHLDLLHMRAQRKGKTMAESESDQHLNLNRAEAALHAAAELDGRSTTAAVSKPLRVQTQTQSDGKALAGTLSNQLLNLFTAEAGLSAAAQADAVEQLVLQVADGMTAAAFLAKRDRQSGDQARLDCSRWFQSICKLLQTQGPAPQGTEVLRSYFKLLCC